ncbi:MAG: TonB-dependent receptor, partial [Burkholderiales bacterium]|nr:TonB-dependent receptor [Burkholderiales bacterium]
NVSNYDVTQKGYTGANINAVTKSGTNEFKGSVYYVKRDDRLVGQRYNSTTDTYFDAPTFKDDTKGITFGGPLISDKLFFFASLEELNSTRNAPGFGPVGSSLTNVGISTAAIAGAQSVAKDKYGIDIGSFNTPSGTKLNVRDALIKLDWNINDNHRASMRLARTEQREPQFPNINATSLSLNSLWYTQGKTIDTAVAQWFADWTPTFSTEMKVSSRKYDSVPTNNANLPAMGLQFTGALPSGAPSTLSTSSRFLNFGTEQSRHLNVLGTKTKDAYLGGNWLLGNNDIKFGADYSNNEIYNAFLQNIKGNYTFNCTNSTATYTYSFGPITCSSATAAQVEAAVLENFSRGRPSSYQVQVPVAGGSLSNAIAKFSLANYGAFVQNTVKFNSNLTVMYGVRLDASSVGDRPLANTAAAAPMVAGNVATNTRQSGGFGMDNTHTIDGQSLVQPRVGFNYTFDSARPMQVRGGVGLFEGAAASVWMSNPFSNPGVATRIVGCGTLGFPACPVAGGIFSADPLTQPTSFAGATPAANVDFLRDGLTQPSVWKANLAFDHELPFGGLVFGIEYLRTKTKDGIFYEHLNLGAPTKTGTDGRQLFYTNQAYNTACWTANGGVISNTPACTGLRSRALNNPSFNNVFAASRTNGGGGNLATISLSQPSKKGFGWSLAYTYTDATEVSPLTSSTSSSNWSSRSSFNPNEQVAANSTSLVKDRINGSLTWQKTFFGTYKTTLGAFFEARSGKPYSWNFSNDLNGDAISGNDLMYIPKAPGSGEVVFKNDTATSHVNEDRFWAIVNAHPELVNAAGGVVKRNGSFSPWSNSIDMRISQEMPGFSKKHKAVFVLDFLNFSNMLNKKWGRINEVAFQNSGGQSRDFVNFAGLDAQGRYIYNVKDKASDLITRQVKGESQWAVQATMRYEF